MESPVGQNVSGKRVGDPHDSRVEEYIGSRYRIHTRCRPNTRDRTSLDTCYIALNVVIGSRQRNSQCCDSLTYTLSIPGFYKYQ